MAGDLVALIDSHDLILRDPADGHAAFMLPGKAGAHKAVIQIKGSLQSILVQKRNKPDILDHTVIVSDIEGFSLAFRV